MKFNNNSNNNARDAVNVNTRGIQLSNSEGFMPSTMVFGFWNSMISIKIHPALEKSQQSDSRRFNYDEVVATTLTLEKTAILLNKIETEILPVYGTQSVFKGVSVGGDSLAGVGLRMNADGTSSTAYFGIFKSLDENTKKPETVMYYEFKSAYTIDDYDPETGDFKMTQNVPGELLLFTSALRAAVSALTNANAHATRTVDKWFRDRLMNTMEEIGSKVGVAPKSKGNWGNNGGGFKSKNVFGNDGGGQSQASELDNPANAAVSQLSNIDDINQFM